MTPDIRIIHPAEGRRVRHPHGPLVTVPTPVTWSSYWERLKTDQDIEVLTEPEAEAMAAAAQAVADAAAAAEIAAVGAPPKAADGGSGKAASTAATGSGDNATANREL